MSQRTLLLSIHPKHANRIFEGGKTVELRRVRPRVEAGDVVLLYVSSPAKAIMGRFTVGGVVEDEPHQIWQKFCGAAAVTLEEFSRYFDQADHAYGILVDKAEVFEEAITLDELRDRMPGFHPPQSYRYFNRKELQLAGIDL